MCRAFDMHLFDDDLFLQGISAGDHSVLRLTKRCWYHRWIS